MSPSEAPQEVSRAVLRDGFLLLGDFQRLDGDGDLARLAVELRDAAVDLFANREPLGTLVAAIAGEFVALDEGGEIGPGDLDLETAVLDLGHLASDDQPLVQVALASVLRPSWP